MKLLMKGKVYFGFHAPIITRTSIMIERRKNCALCTQMARMSRSIKDVSSSYPGHVFLAQGSFNARNVTSMFSKGKQNFLHLFCRRERGDGGAKLILEIFWCFLDIPSGDLSLAWTDRHAPSF